LKKYYMLEQNGKEADVYIFGDITSWPWLESDVTSYTLSKELQALNADTINVHINSYGGEVAEGLAIYNTLKASKATVRTYCEGFACSVASVIFMAGDERYMRNSSLLMIHNAWMSTYGNAEQLRKDADDLDKITQASIAAYMGCVNIEESELRQMLDAETWILPGEALDMGFATSVLADEKTEKPAASASRALYKMIERAIADRSTGTPTSNVPEPQAQEEAPEPEQSPEPEQPKENRLFKFISAVIGGKEIK
jgi:ATP-dependent Clp protease protease subunit